MDNKEKIEQVLVMLNSMDAEYEIRCEGIRYQRKKKR